MVPGAGADEKQVGWIADIVPVIAVGGALTAADKVKLAGQMTVQGLAVQGY